MGRVLLILALLIFVIPVTISIGMLVLGAVALVPLSMGAVSAMASSDSNWLAPELTTQGKVLVLLGLLALTAIGCALGSMGDLD